MSSASAKIKLVLAAGVLATFSVSNLVFCLRYLLNAQNAYVEKTSFDMISLDKGIIGGNATINDTHNYTQLVSLSRNDYMESRHSMFHSWFEGGRTDMLLDNADKNGPILDFIIAGFPKCGTTTVSVNLGYLAPMATGDICTPPSQTVYYAYNNWPKRFGEQKLLRGSKCPQYMNTDGLNHYSKKLPRTKIIIGIRHPVLWYQSFLNQLAGNNLLRYANYDTKPQQCKAGACLNGCPGKYWLCLSRARFHVALAEIGKTALSEEERKILAPNDIDGGGNLTSKNIRNPIFLYEQTELKKDYVWDEMAKYLNVAAIPHDKYISSHGLGKKKPMDLCGEKLDDFRAMLMPYAYDLSVWMQDYFIPVAKNESSDVTIPDPDTFIALVEEYKKDPCGRLYRLKNGTYILDSNRTTIIKVGRK